MKVLIVEDRIETVKGIISHCEEKHWTCQHIAFEEFEKYLKDFNPDVIVLDWKEDASGEGKGGPILERIWTEKFVPIIIFSAIAETINLEEYLKESTLVHIQPKGDEAPVIEYLNSISPFVPVITGLKKEFNKALIEALNSIEMMSKIYPITEHVMLYVFAKRVSTYFDKERGDITPPPWIQYTYPSIIKNLCACDIIRSIPSDGLVSTIGDAEEYMLILTPSCDMAQCKVSHALCAKCYPKEKFHDFGLMTTPTRNQLKRITSLLNTGYNNSLVSLPNIPEVLPYLTADLKKVTLLPIEKIAIGEEKIENHHEYCRIASIDSPFREQIVWAYMINSCRPGVPNRDIENWAKELITS